MASIIVPRRYRERIARSLGDYAHNAGESEYPHLWKGLVGAWMPQLGKQGATTLRDLSGYNNHGTLNGGMDNADWVVGSKGYALDFDGTDDYVKAASVISATEPRPITIHATLRTRTTSASRHSIFTNNGNSGSPCLYVDIGQASGNNYNMRLYSVGYNTSTRTFALDLAWHNYTWEWERDNTIRYYLDGSLLSSSSRALSAGGTGLNIGALESLIGSGFTTDGQISRVLVWSRALSASEILALYQGASPFTLRQGRVYIDLGGAVEEESSSSSSSSQSSSSLSSQSSSSSTAASFTSSSSSSTVASFTSSSSSLSSASSVSSASSLSSSSPSSLSSPSSQSDASSQSSSSSSSNSSSSSTADSVTSSSSSSTAASFTSSSSSSSLSSQSSSSSSSLSSASSASSQSSSSSSSFSSSSSSEARTTSSSSVSSSSSSTALEAAQVLSLRLDKAPRNLSGKFQVQLDTGWFRVN